MRILKRKSSLSFPLQLEVRMHSREKVELFLLATEDGMGPTAAAKFAGVSVGAAKK